MDKFKSKYFNTATFMDEALIDLLDKKEYDYISIKELCDKAGVNRSTFYLHYETMDDLLKETLSYVHKKFEESFSETKLGKSSISSLDLEQKKFITPEYLKPLLSFMKENSKILKLYKRIPNTVGTISSFDKIKNNFLKRVLDDFSIVKAEQNYYIEYYISGIFAIIYAWIDNDCKESMDDMVDLIIRIVIGNKA